MSNLHLIILAFRQFCRSQTASYFAWYSMDSRDVAWRKSCWCKTALASENKIDERGVISGETACDGEHLSDYTQYGL